MKRIAQFYEAIKNDMEMTLATASKTSVTMRVVSPVYYDGNILIFTSPDSVKYRQLSENPDCCIGAGGCFAQAKAVFLGKTMADENMEYRNAYCGKFPGAFDEGVPLGGREAEFILFKPVKLTGWSYENDIPTDDGIPTLPFEINFE